MAIRTKLDTALSLLIQIYLLAGSKEIDNFCMPEKSLHYDFNHTHEFHSRANKVEWNLSIDLDLFYYLIADLYVE